MRKLNQPGRPKAVPCLIPRPPTPPHHSLQVNSVKNIILSNQRQTRSRNQSTNIINNNNNHNNNSSSSVSRVNCIKSNYPSHPQPVVMNDSRSSSNSYLEGDNSSSISSVSSSSRSNNTSSSCLGSNSFDVPEDAIEPNSDFPPPPEEFLEDIRANRKQEEIEGPLDASPSVTPPDSIASSDIDIRQDLHSIQRNSHSSNGYGSLNSSLTEADTPECSSWSPSPTASPLTSPSHSSLDSASIQSLLYQPASSSQRDDHHSSPSRFLFPPPHSTPGAPLITNKPCQQPHSHPHSHPHPHPGVTLAPLLPSSLQREPIYQRLPLHRGAPPLSPASPTLPLPPPPPPPPPPAPVTGTNAGTSSPPQTASAGAACNTPNGPTGTIPRPPDYQTAMKRLSLAKANCGGHHRSNPAHQQHVLSSPPHAQNINTNTTSPLKAVSQFIHPQQQQQQQQPVNQIVPVATVNPRRQPSSPPPLVRCNLTQAMATMNGTQSNRNTVDMNLSTCPSASSQSSSERYHCNRSTNNVACDEIASQYNECSLHDSPPDQQLPLPPRALHSTRLMREMRGERVTTTINSPSSSFSSSSSSCSPPSSGCSVVRRASLTSPLLSRRNGVNTLHCTSRSLPNTPAGRATGAAETPAPPHPPHHAAGTLVKEKVRKRVSFSDQVELVAHSEDMIQEEHLPNPVLERVLGKAFLQCNHINNG